MKQNVTSFFKMGLVALVLSATAISCSKKEDGDVQPSSQAPTRAEVIKKLKNLKYSFSEPNSGNYNYSSSTNSFEYTEPGTGVTYSTPGSSNTYSSGTNTLFGNLAEGGGTFEVDGKTINLDYVFCISGDEESMFGDGPGEGQSMLVGISGKFDPKDEKNSKINYMVIAYISEVKAKGKYDVLFFGDPESTKKKFAFFYVLDLSKVESMEDFEDSPDAKFYFSLKGALNVNNGSIGLENIKMVEILKSEGSEDDELGKEVSASGELSCE